MTILLALLGGVVYRIRGGLLDDILKRELPNNLIRSIWAVFVAAIIATDILTFCGIFLTALAGVIPGYFGGKFDLTLKENRTWRNYAWLSARGMFIVLPIPVIMFLISMVWAYFFPSMPLSIPYQSLWYGVLSGSLMPIYYLAGTVIGRYSKLQSPSQWGEWLIGTMIILAVL